MNDSVTIVGKEVPLKCTLTSHYHIPITRLPADRDKFNQILFIKEITKKTRSEKIKIVTKLHKQFSHPSSKKLCDLDQNAGIRDPEFIKIPVKYAFIIKTLNPVGFSLGSHFNESIAMDIK